jgi:HAD superfamily hydrolase (TIGR01549 family)
MVKVILFDFWGTIVENGVWSPTKQIKKILRINTPFSEYVVRMEKAMMTRKFESLKDAFGAVGKEFSIQITQEQMEELIGMWNKNWMLAKPYQDLQIFLSELGKDFSLVLISNSDNFSVGRVIEKFELHKIIPKRYLSCDVGFIKSQKDFLEYVMSDLGVEPEECVLVGDSIYSDMQAAQNCQIKSILIDRRSSRDYPLRIRNLSELAGVIND